MPATMNVASASAAVAAATATIARRAGHAEATLHAAAPPANSTISAPNTVSFNGAVDHNTPEGENRASAMSANSGLAAAFERPAPVKDHQAAQRVCEQIQRQADERRPTHEPHEDRQQMHIRR